MPIRFGVRILGLAPIKPSEDWIFFMGLKEKGSLAERIECVVYEKDGITYLPHASADGAFVGPGFGKQNFTLFSASELVGMGAVEGTRFLIRGES